jgi:RNA polymerase sigma factor (sigma-70 family)
MIGGVRDDPTVLSLVARAQAGDQSAWDEIVQRYAPLVWATCRRFGLSNADTDDVGASVWLRLVENVDSLREPAALAGWLLTTIRNECLRLTRRAGRQILVGDHSLAEQPDITDTDEWLLLQERRIALRGAFTDLPARCQELLTLLFADPPTPYAQIESNLGIPVGAIGPTRQRCLDRLRRDPRLAKLGKGTAQQ